MQNIKRPFLVFFLFVFIYNGFSQEPKDKVPKQYSFEMGYRNMHTNTLKSNTRNGFCWMIDYAWQLSGMKGEKKKAYISVPIGMQYYYANEVTDTSLRILTYGWTVRHELVRNKKITPYFGYALLLNSMKREGVAGGIMGHQTKTDVGINVKHGKRFQSYYKIEYCYTRFPQYNNKHSIHLSALSFNVGMRF